MSWRLRSEPIYGLTPLTESALDSEANVPFSRWRTFAWPFKQAAVVFVVGANRVNDIAVVSLLVAKRLPVERILRNKPWQVGQGRWQGSLVIQAVEFDMDGDLGAQPLCFHLGEPLSCPAQ